jgi:hypothetical protein
MANELLYWIVGILLISGLAYVVLSQPGVLTPAQPPPCNKCPHAVKTNSDVEGY